MKIIDIIPLTKIPLAKPQILSYFSDADLSTGAVVEIPLGRRQETGVVFDSHEAADLKMEIKKAGYELRPITKIISAEPILTNQQIELALWLGHYYFAPLGVFLKMMMPKINQNLKLKIQNDNAKFKIKKNQKLVLAPTISYAQKLINNYKNAILWHSELSKKQLNEAWWKVKDNETQTIIGTRSAVFLPFQNLKEITIEDETNPAHRSWDMFPHYRTHEVAQKLAEIFDAKLTLKRFLPSVDFHDVRHREKFCDVGRHYIDTRIVDMRAELKDGNFSIFSRTLQKSISEALAQKKQIVLFVNRRGAANFVLCRDCGYVVKCQNCDVPLAHHLISQKPLMFCHRCGYQETPPGLCPQCQSHRIKAVGVGTQKVEMEARKIFSGAKIMRLDSDSASNQKEQQKIIEAFVKKEVDILIATQIIFSWTAEITSAAPALAALISADTLLHLPDFRSGERTFQTITLLKNLLNPPSKKIPPLVPPFTKGGMGGIFIIQTYNPESSVIKYAAQSDWQSFYQEEIETRQTLGYPPFSQIVKLTFRHRDPKKAGQEAKILAAKLTNVIVSAAAQLRGGAKQSRGNTDKHEIAALRQSGARNDGFTVISDALPAFIPKEKGKFVWNIIIKFKLSQDVIPTPQLRGRNLSTCLRKKMSKEFLLRRNSLLQYVPSNWEIDIDPSDLL